MKKIRKKKGVMHKTKKNGSKWNDARDKEVHEGRREDLKKGLKKEGLKGRKGVMREERM